MSDSMRTETWITLAVFLLVVVRFLARELRDRRIVLGRMFLVPAIVGAIALYLIVLTVMHAPGLAGELAIGAVAAAIVGFGVGLAVNRFTSVRPAADPSAVIVRGSYATVAIWVAALLLRLVGRVLAEAANLGGGAILMLNACLVVLLAVAIVTVRLQIARRAQLLRLAGQAGGLSTGV
jgi:hypothetical protein